MRTHRLAGILGILAAAGLAMALAGCGGSSPKTSISPPPPVNSVHKAQVLLFPVLTQGSPNFSDFMANILPNVSGVSVSMKWSEITEPTQGTYDFTAFDANLQPYIAAGKEVNLIVWPATEGGNNDPNTSGSTPAWVFSQSYASSLSPAAPPQDMAVCGSYNGDSNNPFYAQATSGGGGVWNITTSPDLSGLPISYEAPFMTAYQGFIQAVIQHYNGNGNIGYIRFGMSQGGEDSPECNPIWPIPSSAPDFKTAYLAYVQTMRQFVAAQNPTVTILADLHAVGSTPDYTYADQEASYAIAAKEGMGTNGLQQSDITTFASGGTCDSDWCALFQKYGSTTYGGTPITLSLQTLQWSDPTGASQTGSLATIGAAQGLIPFAQGLGMNNIELYLADAALAFSPNYCNYPHAQCSTPNYNQAQYATAYKAAIQAYLAAQ